MPSQAVKVELFYDGAWQDITAVGDVFTEPIVITRGQGDESPSPRPAQIGMRLANDDDRYRTSNPVSPLYGKAGRNTPIRVSVGSTVRCVAEASSWAADQTQEFRQSPPRGKAWVDVQAGGLLQRINQWSQPLRSPLYRAVALSGTTPAEYWPMEDVSGSGTAVSAVSGTAMTPVAAVRYTLPDGSVLPPGGAPEFGRGSGVGGSDKLPSFQGGGTLAAPVRTSTFDGYAIDWVMQFAAGTDEGGTTTADILSWRESGTYVHFTVNVIKGFVTVFHANASDDTTLSSTGSATASFDVYDGAPHHFRYQVRQSGGSYLAQLLIDSAVWATADNFVPGMTGTVGRPTSVEWNPGEDRGDYLPIAAGHLIVWASGQLGLQPPVFYDLNGRAGERAGVRFGRLLDEEGIPYNVSASYAESMPMGPQRVDTLANLLQEILTTEDGLLYDVATDVSLQFTCRVDRYNQTPALALTPNDLPALPREVTDDLNVHNVVTASQREGGDYTARDDTGPLGTEAPPDGVGEYRQSVDVSVSSEEFQLPQVANWWLRRGTVDLPRFPQVTLDLGAKPALVTSVEAVEVGSVITITGMRENTIRLIVLGWTEMVDTHTRTITFTCVPDQQFQPAVYDDTGRRYDSRTSTLNASYSATATTMVVTFTDSRDAWSTVNEPYDWVVAGERITVTSMAAVVGAGPYTQSATVTRAVNGISKAQTSGAAVHMHPDQQARYAL
jgi:hypothetical protein